MAFPSDLKENLINAVHDGELTVEFVNNYFDVKAEMEERGLSIPDQEETEARLKEEKRRRTLRMKGAMCLQSELSDKEILEFFEIIKEMESFDELLETARWNRENILGRARHTVCSSDTCLRSSSLERINRDNDQIRGGTI